MRVALAMLLAFAFGLQAGAQTPKRRPFAEADYETYFSEGSMYVKSPTFGSTGAEQYYWRNGKPMLSSVEVMPRWDRASPYPFVKAQSEHAYRLGIFDKTLKARAYERADPGLNDDDGNRVWLSKDNRTTISPGDVSMGSARDYYKTLSRAAGRDPEADDAAYRRAITGRWMYTCEFVKAPTYDVECVDTNLTTGQSAIRRFRKQAGMS